jgi:hypothetical protein
MDLVRQRVVKEELRSELIILATGCLRADCKVDMYSPARIRTWVDGEELNLACPVR